MIARKTKTKKEDKSSARNYLKKAEDNYKQMLSALDGGNYNAAGTLAIQCAISAADAICIHEKSIRSLSQNHMDLCDLVKSITLNEAKEKSVTLKRIIAKKNLVQYESRSIYKSEADNMVKWAARFYKWVSSVIK
jgi:HEPN domain-containing protein